MVVTMNINVNTNNNLGGLFGGGISMFQGGGLKSTQEKQERQQKAANQIEFWENQKDNLKNMACETLEEIAQKLEMYHTYEDEISAVKAAYNHQEMFHVLDEAREIGEKIAEAVKETEPKTAEECREEMAEEALETEESEGESILEEITEEMQELIEEVQDEAAEELAEKTVQQLEQATAGEELSEAPPVEQAKVEALKAVYKRMDIRV